MADTEFTAAFDAATAGKVIRPASDGGTFIALPEGYSVHDLEGLQMHPNRIKSQHVFRDVKSIAAYLERFEKPQSVAFSKPDERLIDVWVDHHNHNHLEGPKPSHCDHHASFRAIFTAQYKLWRTFCDNWVTQKQAGEFLEERAVDVIEPDAASIMDMVMQFDALKRVEFKQSTRLHDSTRQFQYVEENEARGALTLPERLTLRLPVFDGMEPDRFTVRLRYDIADGKLRFRFCIHDQKELEDTAFYRCEDALSAARPDLLILRSV